MKTGDKITITMKDILGDYYTEKITIARDGIEHHGYISETGGSWGLYQVGETKIPCYEVIVRRYRKQSRTKMRLNYHVYDFKHGWEE
ncbi:hypothetical protein P4V41_07700 [Fictibacillus nanhaiensis]|uniref:hypothetical protein n=1 Tax=Fictibacillus nanhaiensis TaxID=742169 RepID=UPI002E1EB21F|nr:hypothetical protein [Fictibacillus nanhaiensis]